MGLRAGLSRDYGAGYGRIAAGCVQVYGWVTGGFTQTGALPSGVLRIQFLLSFGVASLFVCARVFAAHSSSVGVLVCGSVVGTSCAQTV